MFSQTAENQSESLSKKAHEAGLPCLSLQLCSGSTKRERLNERFKLVSKARDELMSSKMATEYDIQYREERVVMPSKLTPFPRSICWQISRVE